MSQAFNYRNRILCVAIFLFSLPLSLFSETIIMRNGNVKKGKILSQDKLTVIFEEKEGKTPEVFSKKEILKISYKDLTRAEINQIIKEYGGPEVVDVSPSAPISETSRRQNITVGRALLRSAILPGWGQMYQNRQVASTAYFFLFLGGIGFVAHQYKEYRSEIDDYDYKTKSYIFTLYFRDPSTQFFAKDDLTTQKSHVDRALHRAEIAGGVLAGIYLLNLFDVVIFRPKDNLSLRASAFTDQMSIKLEYRF